MTLKTKIIFLLCAVPLKSQVEAFSLPFSVQVTSYLNPSRTLWRSQTRLNADSLINDERRDRKRKRNQKEKWPRRIWLKILRKQPSRKAATPLHMQSIDEETEALLESISQTYNEDFILRNLQAVEPDMVLPVVSPSDIDSEFYGVAITQSDSAALSIKEAAAQSPSDAPKSISSISVTRWMGSICENVLTGIITRNAVEEPEDLSVQASPRGNVLARLVCGRLRTDAKLEVGRLVFPNLRMSKGTLNVKRMTLNVMGFLTRQRESTSRFPRQFDLHADDFTFSRHDLLFSRCIRNGLKTLLVRILKDRGIQPSTIKVTSLDILPSGKVSVKGAAKTLFGSILSFEVRSGISTSSRGHVLTFPGLEVALNRDIGLFVPVVPTIDLDIGHNARFRKIEIDGKQKLLRLSASVTITPKKTVRLNDYVQSSKAFAARFHFDVGQWLTRIGNFNH